tara:strand:- start:5392 stop:6012 length:621 start_codon:yes stop_codon:yes gene_type:complete
MFNQFIIVAVAHFLAVISPGPDFFIISRQSLLYGRKSAIYTSFGIAFGILIHVSYCVLGFDFISNNELVLVVIKIFCSIYLFYLGFLSILFYKKNVKNINNDKETDSSISNFSSFKIGLLTNLLNLKATLFFLSIFSFINSSGEIPFLMQVFYGFWMVLITGIWFLILSYFFTNIFFKKMFNDYIPYIHLLTGFILIYISVKIYLN